MKGTINARFGFVYKNEATQTLEVLFPVSLGNISLVAVAMQRCKRRG